MPGAPECWPRGAIPPDLVALTSKPGLFITFAPNVIFATVTQAELANLLCSPLMGLRVLFFKITSLLEHGFLKSHPSAS